MGVNPVRVVICGAAGRMGLETAKSVLSCSDMRLVGCVDINLVGEPVTEALSLCGVTDLCFTDDLASVLSLGADVMVDFSGGAAACENIVRCLEKGVACVVGSTGISDDDMKKICSTAARTGAPVFIAPNFSVGAALMMKFAAEAAKFYQWAEIIELHHEKKKDAPSGTAIRTAEMMSSRSGGGFASPVSEFEKIVGVRGGICEGVRIHSVRLPGLLAHQEVLLGGVGETLTLRHDSMSRECFMPGVMLSIRRVRDLSGVVVGIENIM